MTLRTSLYQKHVDLKAKIVDFAGWDMPVQYTSVKDETLAVRKKVGVFDVSHMGEFFAEGPDAIKFIDSLVTNDIASAAMGKAIYSPLCRENGTVVDDLIVYKLAEQKLLICVNASNIQKDFEWMNAHAGKYDVRFTNKSEHYSLLALQGPESEGILKKFIPNLPSLEYYSVWESGQTIIARTGYTGEDGFEIFGSHEYIGKLWDQLIAAGVTPCGLASRDVLRLEVCYPLYGHELNDEITPLDAALAWTVKLNKTSFIGKTALTDYKPKYKLVKLLVEKAIPREGYHVVDENDGVIGVVTSGTMSVVLNQGVAFARISSDKFSKGQNYFIDIRQKKYPATLVTKPFVQGGHK
ncbi:MAG: glycine cleavage system aminomethyltransferase GcvT [Bacteriovoracaceae bacterium]|nr:glycine cleavage system aminomethyltransferase GcvT [Bacteriovoracaceae bacterium]